MLKNYTTKVPASKSITEIQMALVDHGATGVLFEYEQGTGRIAALKFKLRIKDRDSMFMLPVDWKDFQAVMQEQGIRRANDDDYAYRVAWRILRDWVMAQMAIIEAKNIDVPQLLLGFAMASPNKTVYQTIRDKGFFLGSGEE